MILGSLGWQGGASELMQGSIRQSLVGWLRTWDLGYSFVDFGLLNCVPWLPFRSAGI